MTTFDAPLPADRLRTRCDPLGLGFTTTADLQAGAEVAPGQARAAAAIRFAVGMRGEGFNLFVLGPPGVGKHALLTRLLAETPPVGESARDWCYVNNFADPQRPRALSLPRGRGVALRDALDRLIEELQSTIPAAFDSDEYRARVEQIDREFNELQQQAFGEIAETAGAQDIALLRTPSGFSFAPMKEREVISPEDFARLPEDTRERFGQAIGKLQEQLEKAIHKVAGWRRERFEKLKALNQEITMSAVGSVVDELKRDWADLPEVIAYLEAVREDVTQNAEIFLHRQGETPEGAPPGGNGELPATRRYKVNLLVDDGMAKDAAAPVLREDNPTLANLVGRVEYLARFGALVTDFNLIRAGALHRANGGTLLLDAVRVLSQPFAWEGLKRALSTREIRIESPAQQLGMISTVSLEPQPIPLGVKVVLFGDRLLYYLLQQYDPDFGRLFKVAADFEDDMPRSAESQRAFASLIAGMVRERDLLPFDRGAVARVIDDAARAAGDAERLSLRLSRTGDLLAESEYWTRQAGRPAVESGDVERAIAAREERADRIKQRMLESTTRGILHIATAGAVTGQINGLAVFDMGDAAFGHPTRITAALRVGDGQVIDIQRESSMGGPLHSRGVMILGGFLAERYSPRRALSLTASLVFEQTYGPVDGDSASLAETCALLSALAQVPIAQRFAVTGSIDQRGNVQAIGGVNEKIEGFFDLCAARGLDGGQGVLIPATNVAHLMLRDDVVEACRAGRFAVHAVTSVDQAIELLTGMPAGSEDALGRFPPDSFNQRVHARLDELARHRRSAATGEAPRRRRERGDGRRR